MTHDEHRERHKLLHEHLDELLADFLVHNWSARPSTTTLIELMRWSHAQTIDPDEKEGAAAG